MDIEEVLSSTRQGDFYNFVANVVKLFDTFDRYISDCALGKRGLPDWFRGGFTSLFTGKSGPHSNLALDWVFLGVEMVALSKDAHSAWSLWFCAVCPLVPSSGEP